MAPAVEGLRRFIIGEASKCLFCGFCEPVCPTLSHGPHRGYGPRGRVRLASMLVEGGRLSGEPLGAVIESIYSCLLCGSCNLACPAGVDIVSVVRASRALLNSIKGSTE